MVGSFDPDATVAYVEITPEIQAIEARGAVYPIPDMDVYDKATIDVVFPDGELVTETLEELETEVRALLMRFGREFVLRPV
ncbi:MAG: hypothetical protein LC808_32805 [Actinobacteria bacterium]|nr:hypothetical protein [Actinomycetota bacterium]